MLEMCRTPDLAVEATMQPVRRLGVDAAVLFSDIVVPLQAMGVDLEIRPGVGPVIASPIRELKDVERLHSLDPGAAVPYVSEAIKILVGELEVPLIGFAGAPFTLACYLIEGGPSKTHARTKALMYSQPDTWDRLMNVLADAVSFYLRAQIEAGAGAVKILTGLGDLGVPRIHFGVGASHLLGLMTEAGADVIGVDWRIPLEEARVLAGAPVTVQGNLDPAACLAPWNVLEEKALAVLDSGGGRSHVFNLGHGVLPQTDPDVLARVVDIVHAWQPV